MIIYVDEIKAPNVGYKVAFLPVAVIEKRYKGSKGLHAHELEHIKQYLVCFAVVGGIGLFLTSPLIALAAAMMAHDAVYNLSSKYRRWAEVQAYKKQLQFGASIDEAAEALSKHYRLKLSVEEAKKLLQ